MPEQWSKCSMTTYLLRIYMIINLPSRPGLQVVRTLQRQSLSILTRLYIRTFRLPIMWDATVWLWAICPAIAQPGEWLPCAGILSWPLWRSWMSSVACSSGMLATIPILSLTVDRMWHWLPIQALRHPRRTRSSPYRPYTPGGWSTRMPTWRSSIAIPTTGVERKLHRFY